MFLVQVDGDSLINVVWSSINILFRNILFNTFLMDTLLMIDQSKNF